MAHNDVHFIAATDFEAHEARVCIADGYVLGDNRRPRSYTPEQYFKTAEEMTDCFQTFLQRLKTPITLPNAVMSACV